MRNQIDLLRYSDWQTLIIMDAARFDYTYEVAPDILKIQPGRVEEVYNGGAINTHFWYELMFARRQWVGLHLLSAHPSAWHPASKHLLEAFAQCIPLWKDERFNDPSFVMESATYIDLQAWERLMVHMIPPHLPFISKQGQKFMKGIHATISQNKFMGGPTNYKTVEIWGKINGWDVLRYFYKENLRLALTSIAQKIDLLAKPVVITADHGEMIGEEGKYDHNHEHSVITSVPYIEIR